MTESETGTPTPAASGKPDKTVAVVLTGAAARGAFQAGALATLLPALAAQGVRPSIFVGTSAGAINAALSGSLAHLAPQRAADSLLDVWRSMDRPRVLLHPMLSVLQDSARLLPGALAGIGRGLPGLLDTSPLRRTAYEVFDAAQLATNIDDRTVSAVGVVATRAPAGKDHIASARCVLFLDTTLPTDGVADFEGGIDLAEGRINPDHILASAAIPVGFPAVHVDSPPSASGWYVDGGVRLNAPLRPAVALGADHIIVIAADATHYPDPVPPSGPDSPWPDVADAAALTMQSSLADRMIADLRDLRSRNRWAEAHIGATSPSGRPYRSVELTTVSPQPGELAELANSVVAAKRRSWLRSMLRESDTFALQRLLRGIGQGGGPREMLSYVLFDDEYFAAQIELGRTAAEAVL